jgi:hypothetical protein
MTGESRARPVLWLGGVAAGALVLSNGLPPLTPDEFDWIGPAVGLLGLTITAVLTAATQQRVVPTENVEARAYVDDNGVRRVIAGEGSTIKTGEPVDVTPATPSNWVA